MCKRALNPNSGRINPASHFFIRARTGVREGHHDVLALPHEVPRDSRLWPPCVIDQAQTAHRRRPQTCNLTRSWLSRKPRQYPIGGLMFSPSARASARMSILPTLTRTVTACETREDWCKVNPKRRRPDTNCSHQAVRRPRGTSMNRRLSVFPHSQIWAHARRQRPRSTPNPAPSGTQVSSQRNTDPRWLPSSPQHPGNPQGRTTAQGNQRAVRDARVHVKRGHGHCPMQPP